MTRGPLLAVFLLLASSALLAQGGPPLLTDDPGTPGNGNWEINLGFTFDHRPGSSQYEVPQLDINYGYGERLQLKYQVPWVMFSEGGAGRRDGLGNSLFGVKWRFFENEKHGLELSTYPQLELNNPNRSVQRGLADRGAQFLLPIEVVKKVGSFDVNGEAGYWFPQYGPGAWIFGLAVGRQMNQRLELLAEVYDFQTARPGQTDTTFDGGGRLKLKGPLVLLFMAGRSFLPASSGQSQFIGYIGMQFLFSTHRKARPPHEPASGRQ